MKSLLARWTGMSLSARIIIGLGAGVFAGLFLGEPAGALQPVADAYIRLMQMTVLPYLVTSLVIAFGQLDTADARRLVRRGGTLLLLVWLLTAAVIVALPLAFPEVVSASFFSRSMVEPRTPFSLTDIYFTSNLFDALSRNLVPAVVLFSCLLGVALMGIEGKERLLAPLRTWNEAITRITHYIIELTPYGVFAIAAVAAGTMVPETFTQLAVYFIVFIVASLLLAGWILPLLVTAVTPFRYREVSGIARDALLTAFVANSAFIVLPILIERSKELLDRHGLLDEQTGSTAEVMIPVLFNFPNAGKLLTLLFVPFAGWLAGQQLVSGDLVSLLAAGIPSYFAKAQVALPFLLDLFRLPHDLFQLYIPTTIVTGKFDSMVTAMNLLVFALLGAGAMGGFLVFDRRRLLKAGAAIVTGSAAATILTAWLLGFVIEREYHLDESILAMRAVAPHADTIVHRGSPPNPEPDVAQEAPTLAGILARGSLRIGYVPDNLPMAFFNSQDELVGFEVTLGEELAATLGVRAEFVPVTWPDVPRLLDARVIDVMPGAWFRPFWFTSVRLSDPYFVATVGLAVRDERRHEFADVQHLRMSHGLRIGIPISSNQVTLSMQRYFGGSDVEFVVVDFWKAFFEGEHPDLDAFLMPAEHASGWSLLYPQYTVVVPQPDPVRLPTAFGLARDAEELTELVNEWVVYAKSAGIIQESFNYWVQGEGAKSHTQRWSIARNVLGWIE